MWLGNGNEARQLIVQLYMRYERSKSDYMRQLQENPEVQRSQKWYS